MIFLFPASGGVDLNAWYDDFGNRYLIFTDAEWYRINALLAQRWILSIHNFAV